MKKKLFTIILVIHLFFWVFDNTADYLGGTHSGTLHLIILFNLFATIPFYLNYFVFVPKLLKGFRLSNVLKWAGAFFGFYIIYRAFHLVLFYHFVLDVPYDEFETIEVIKNGLFTGIFYCSISTGSRLLWEWLINIQENKTLQLQKTENQLQLLKSNINLPFVMDTLNVLEQKSKEDPESIQNEVIELSNVMRYTLYKTQNEKVDLSEEMEILTDQLSLYKVVYKKEVNINSEVIGNAKVISGYLYKIVAECQKHINKNILITLKKNQETIQLSIPCIQEEFEKIRPIFPQQLTMYFENDHMIAHLN